MSCYRYVVAKGERIYSFIVLDLGTRWGKWLTSPPICTLTPGIAPGTQWIGGRVDLRAGLNTESREKIRCFCRRSNPGLPGYSQTLCQMSYLRSRPT
jgi:hypothetical protein